MQPQPCPLWLVAAAEDHRESRVAEVGAAGPISTLPSSPVSRTTKPSSSHQKFAGLRGSRQIAPLYCRPLSGTEGRMPAHRTRHRSRPRPLWREPPAPRSVTAPVVNPRQSAMRHSGGIEPDKLLREQPAGRRARLAATREPDGVARVRDEARAAPRSNIPPRPTRGYDSDVPVAGRRTA
jgi:hypothetical protein